MSDFEIVTRQDFSDVTYLLEVRHPLMAKAAKPGQFVIVMEHEHGERIRCRRIGRTFSRAVR